MKPVLREPLMDVLVLLADGADTAEVAKKLHLSHEAAKRRALTVVRELGAQSRAQAVAVAYRAGVLGGEPVELPHLLAVKPPVNRLIEARMASGMSQAQVAARMGHSQAWLCQRESGRQPFTVGEVHEYAQLVGVDLGGQP